jgi:SAM-dependent methyltransferase
MNNEKEWWQSFFSGLWLDVQRARMADRTSSEADFIESCLRLEPGNAVLDVPCGEGRLSLELASRGYELTGVDVTLPLLEDARAKSSARGLSLTLEHMDMRDLPWKGAFDGAFCFWGSFGYFDDDGNRAFLQRIHDALRPGARFVFDALVAEGLLPIFRKRDWWLSGDVLVAEERTYDFEASRIEGEWKLIRGDQQDERRSSMRVYSYRELIEILKSVGFSTFEAFSSLDKEPFTLGRRLFLVAGKEAS